MLSGECVWSYHDGVQNRNERALRDLTTIEVISQCVPKDIYKSSMYSKLEKYMMCSYISDLSIRLDIGVGFIK